jgi:hypothetical protein
VGSSKNNGQLFGRKGQKMQQNAIYQRNDKDTSTIIAVIAGEAEKPRLIERTQDATIVAPPSIDWEIGNAFSAMLS